MARRKRTKRKFPHIYFESKKPRTRDSVTLAVRDIGKAGVSNSKEVCALAIAQFLDWLDRRTFDHYGNVLKFSNRLWSNRLKILKWLAKKFGGMRCVKYVDNLKKQVVARKISKKDARDEVIEYAKKNKLPLAKVKI